MFKQSASQPYFEYLELGFYVSVRILTFFKCTHTINPVGSLPCFLLYFRRAGRSTIPVQEERQGVVLRQEDHEEGVYNAVSFSDFKCEGYAEGFVPGYYINLLNTSL